MHTLAEDYVKGKISRLPKGLKLFEGEFKKLKAKYKKGVLTDIMVEDNWAFTNEWLGTVWNDWVNCWVRIKLDLAHLTEPGILEVIDWKTGKFRQENNEDYLEQLELYALGAFLTLPQINEVRRKLKYLDHGITYPPEGTDLIYRRADLSKLKKAWEKRVKAMMNDKIFAPKPNNLCKWCFYRKSNKGDRQMGVVGHASSPVESSWGRQRLRARFLLGGGRGAEYRPMGRSRHGKPFVNCTPI